MSDFAAIGRYADIASLFRGPLEAAAVAAIDLTHIKVESLVLVIELIEALPPSELREAWADLMVRASAH